MMELWHNALKVLRGSSALVSSPISEGINVDPKTFLMKYVAMIIKRTKCTWETTYIGGIFATRSFKEII
jgi:hypothetical protein